MGTHRYAWLALAAALAAMPGGAAEDMRKGTAAYKSTRALNGHVFQPSRLVPGPFTTTSFGTSTIFGSGSTNAPRFNRQGEVIGDRDYTTAAYGQGFDFHVRLTPDIGLRFEVSGLFFSGVDGESFVALGTNGQVGLSGGLVAGRDLAAGTRLAFVIDVGQQPELSLVISRAIINAIDTGEFRTAGVFNTAENVRVAPGVSFAWAPSPPFGIELETRYAYTRTVGGDANVDRNANGAIVGGLAEFDFEPVMRWPIAVQAGYRGQIPWGATNDRSIHEAGVGIFYSRMVPLALGLEIDWRHGNLRTARTVGEDETQPTLKSDSAIATLRFRYYW